jgi:hypothetical protein
MTDIESEANYMSKDHKIELPVVQSCFVSPVSDLA